MNDPEEARWQDLYNRAANDPRAWLEWRQHPNTCNTDPLAIKHVSDLVARVRELEAAIGRVRALCDEPGYGPLYERKVRAALRGSDEWADLVKGLLDA